MNKTFIHKNANMFLLYWVAVLAITLVGVSIYFQHTFTQINAELFEKSNKLEAQQKFLSYVTGELDVKNERERKLLEKFEEVSTNNEHLSLSCTRLENKPLDGNKARSNAIVSIFPKDDVGRSY